MKNGLFVILNLLLWTSVGNAQTEQDSAMLRRTIELHFGITVQEAVGVAAGITLFQPFGKIHGLSIGAFYRQKVVTNQNGRLEGSPIYHDDRISQLAIPVIYRVGDRGKGAAPIFFMGGGTIDFFLHGTHGTSEFDRDLYKPTEVMGIVGLGGFIGRVIIQAQLHIPITDPYPKPPNSEDFTGKRFLLLTAGVRVW